MKKKDKNPCEGCVWQLWTGLEKKVLCPFSKCRRAEYAHILTGPGGRGNEKTEGH